MTSLIAGGVCAVVTILLTNLLCSSAFPVQLFGDEPVRLAEEVYVTEINNISVCVVDGDRYTDGQSIPTVDPCESCICHPPGFVCTQSTCSSTPPPGCQLLPAKPHQCCPDFVCNEPERQKTLSYRGNSPEDSPSEIPISNTDVTILDESTTQGNDVTRNENAKATTDQSGSNQATSIVNDNDVPSTQDPSNNGQTESAIKNVYTAGFVKIGGVVNSDKTKPPSTESTTSHSAETKETSQSSEKDSVSDLPSSTSTLPSVPVTETKTENSGEMVGDQPKADEETGKQNNSEANVKPTVAEEQPTSTSINSENISSYSHTTEDQKDIEVTSTGHSVTIQDPTSSQTPKHADPKSKSYDPTAVTETDNNQDALTKSDIISQPVNESEILSTGSTENAEAQQQTTTTFINPQTTVPTQNLPTTNNLNKEQTDTIEDRSYVSKDYLITSPPLQRSTQTVNYTLNLIAADQSTTVTENSESATERVLDGVSSNLNEANPSSSSPVSSPSKINIDDNISNDEKSQTNADESYTSTVMESDTSTTEQLNNNSTPSTPGSLRAINEQTEDKLNVKDTDSSTSGSSLPQTENNENNVKQTNSDDVVTRETIAVQSTTENESNVKPEKTGIEDVSTEPKSEENTVSTSSVVESMKENEADKVDKEKSSVESAPLDQPSENITSNSVPKPGTILIDTSIEISPENSQSCNGNCSDLSSTQTGVPNLVDGQNNLEETNHDLNLQEVGKPDDKIPTSPATVSEQDIKETSGPIVFPNHTLSSSNEHELRPRDAQRKNITTVNNSNSTSIPDLETSTTANREEEYSENDQSKLPQLQYRIVPAELEPELVTRDDESASSLQQSNNDATTEEKISNNNNNTESPVETVHNEEINTELSFLSSPLDDVNVIQEENLLTEEDSRRPEARKDDNLADTNDNSKNDNVSTSNIETETSMLSEPVINNNITQVSEAKEPVRTENSLANQDVSNSNISDYEKEPNSNPEGENLKEDKAQDVISTTNVPAEDNPTNNSEVPHDSSVIEIDNRKVEIVPEYHVTSELSTNSVTSTLKDTASSEGFALPQVVAEKESIDSDFKTNVETSTGSVQQDLSLITSNSEDDNTEKNIHEANDKENTNEQSSDSTQSNTAKDDSLAKTNDDVAPLQEPTLTSDKDNNATDNANKDQVDDKKEENDKRIDSNSSGTQDVINSESNKSTEPSETAFNKNYKAEFDYSLLADEPARDENSDDAPEKTTEAEEQKLTNDSDVTRTESSSSQTKDGNFDKVTKENVNEEKIVPESGQKDEFTTSIPEDKNSGATVLYASEVEKSTYEVTIKENDMSPDVSNSEQEESPKVSPVGNAETATDTNNAEQESDAIPSTSYKSTESIKRAKIDTDDTNTDSPAKYFSVSSSDKENSPVTEVPEVTTHVNKIIQEEKEVGIFHIVNKLLIDTTTTSRGPSDETSTLPSSLSSISDGVLLDGFLSGRVPSNATTVNNSEGSQSENNRDPIPAVEFRSTNSKIPTEIQSTESSLSTRSTIIVATSSTTDAPIAESTVGPKSSESSFTVIENSSENYISPLAEKEVIQDLIPSSSPEDEKIVETVQSSGSEKNNEVNEPVVTENASQPTAEVPKESDESSDKLNESEISVPSSASPVNQNENNPDEPVNSKSDDIITAESTSDSPNDFESLTSSTQKEMPLETTQSQVTNTSTSKVETSTNQQQFTEQPLLESTVQEDPIKQARLDDNGGNSLTSTNKDSLSTESATVGISQTEKEKQEPASSNDYFEVSTQAAATSDQQSNDKTVLPLRIDSSEVSPTVKDELPTSVNGLLSSTIVPGEVPISGSPNEESPLKINENKEKVINPSSEITLIESTNTPQLPQTEDQSVAEDSKSEDNLETEKPLENVEENDQTSLPEITAIPDKSTPEEPLTNPESTSSAVPQTTTTTTFSSDSNVNNDSGTTVSSSSPGNKESIVSNENATNQTSEKEHQTTTNPDKQVTANITHESSSVWSIISDLVSSTISPLFTNQPAEGHTS